MNLTRHSDCRLEGIIKFVLAKESNHIEAQSVLEVSVLKPDGSGGFKKF
jgi:hypothetical protein